MSALTEKILCGIDYEEVKKIRVQNYLYLQEVLASSNHFEYELKDNAVPMVFPYLSNHGSLLNRLIQNKIYIATYWPNISDWCDSNQLEFTLYKNLISIPVDQRLSVGDMNKILDFINKN